MGAESVRKICQPDLRHFPIIFHQLHFKRLWPAGHLRLRRLRVAALGADHAPSAGQIGTQQLPQRNHLRTAFPHKCSVAVAPLLRQPPMSRAPPAIARPLLARAITARPATLGRPGLGARLRSTMGRCQPSEPGPHAPGSNQRRQEPATGGLHQACSRSIGSATGDPCDPGLRCNIAVILRVPALHSAHQHRKRFLMSRHSNQMDMIRHQAPPQQTYVGSLQIGSEQFEISGPINVCGKDITAVDAALCDVIRNVRQNASDSTRHSAK